MRRRTGRRGIVGVLVLGGLLLAGGVAYATIPGADGTITGCFNKNSGTLRLIDTEAGQACTPAENQISWKQAAMLTCPAGTLLSTGVCIETSPRTAGSHSEAEDDCADEGRRLPSGGELTTFAEVDGITLSSGGEWTDDVADANISGTFHYFMVADPGNGIQEAFEDEPYRCVAGAGIG